MIFVPGKVLTDKKQAVQESLQTVANLVEEILSMDLPINKRADNVRNLLFRKKCLELVRDKLYEQFFEEEIKSFESVDLATIKEFWINPKVLNNLVPEQQQKLIASM